MVENQDEYAGNEAAQVGRETRLLKPAHKVTPFSTNSKNSNFFQWRSPENRRLLHKIDGELGREWEKIDGECTFSLYLHFLSLAENQRHPWIREWQLQDTCNSGVFIVDLSLWIFIIFFFEGWSCHFVWWRQNLTMSGSLCPHLPCHMPGTVWGFHKI